MAGYRRGWIDPVLMRAMDVLLAFPPLLFLLVLATGFGSSAAWRWIVGIAIVHMPGVARIVRTAALEVSVRGYVEAAVARGDALATDPALARSCRTSSVRSSQTPDHGSPSRSCSSRRSTFWGWGSRRRRRTGR